MTAQPLPEQGRLIAEGPDITLITGLSGAGRSEAAKCLEDLGYFVVDNLPPSLIAKMAELVETGGGPQRVAIVADARGGKFFGDLANALSGLRERRVPTRILFLEASEDILVHRFAETRRKHPLAPEDRRVEGIRREREVMEALRGEADLIIDTSEMTPRDLRERIREVFARSSPHHAVQVAVVSFGYKYGVPRDADLVLDVRFLPNPYWIDHLRPLVGTEDSVRRYVMEQPQYAGFVEKLQGLLDEMLPGYLAEGKSYLTVAVGCTGGRHRSVVVAEELAAYFRDKGLPVVREHRDLARG
ncbi:MAG: RNase adapter RapZ [Actinomycetota bacterium]|nr:RNase adapter RapZ [Actinomycetota bacterium]